MKDFGIRFGVNDDQRFEQLAALWAEIKRDKDGESFRDPGAWIALVPDAVKANFVWPMAEERSQWLGVRPFTPIAIPSPGGQLGARWDFYRVLESIEEGEYGVLGCVRVSDGVGELRIDPYSYPYGGVGALIALAEAFGFEVLGVNEYGKYESRAALLEGGSAGGEDALTDTAGAKGVASSETDEPPAGGGMRGDVAIMGGRKFQPGFRLSGMDVVVLVVGGVACVYTMTVDRWVGIAIGFVVLHFFLFCNVLRMSRSLELIWAGVFAGLAVVAISQGLVSWPVVFGVSSVITVVVAVIEMRRASYHGVGWRRLNPGLPEWWQGRMAGGAG